MRDEFNEDQNRQVKNIQALSGIVVGSIPAIGVIGLTILFPNQNPLNFIAFLAGAFIACISESFRTSERLDSVRNTAYMATVSSAAAFCALVLN